MKNIWGTAAILLISALFFPAQARSEYRKPVYDYFQQYKKTPTNVEIEDDYSTRYRAGRFMKEVFEDAFNIHKYLFTWDTYKVFATTFPVFVGARIIDEDLQNHFYDRKHHRNRYKIPKWCHDVAEYSVGIPIVLLGLNAFCSRNKELQMTSRVFLTGIPFVIFGKDFIKRIRAKAALRPWHEKFDCKRRAGGGFPSGHAAEAAYTAILYGMRFGPRFAIPLSLVTVFVGGSFIACNRHYASQVIAGIGLGAMYALAANKVIEDRLAERNIKVNVAPNARGGADLTVSCRF